MSELQRLAVFIDYQNAYHGARQAQGATKRATSQSDSSIL